MTIPEPILILDRVERVFPSGREHVAAVREVNLHVMPTEAVAITGPSGSGKTTLLNLIAGLDRPTSGVVRVLGTDIGSLSERQVTAFRARHVGLIFQDPQLLPGLTALENVVVARLPWASRKSLEPEARRILEAVGLSSRMDHPPSRLSGGERQRVGIARALMGKPKLLLADEPTGNLDSKSTEALLELLGQLRRELDLTIMVATHDLAVAAAMTRTVRMVDGRVEFDGGTNDSQVLRTTG